MERRKMDFWAAYIFSFENLMQDGASLPYQEKAKIFG
jgi:hypothetical protein